MQNRRAVRSVEVINRPPCQKAAIFPNGAGRDALPLDPRQHVRWSCPVCRLDGRGTPAPPASHVWNASVDVLRRTRRNAYTIRGAAPDVNHRTSCRASRGARPYHRTTAAAPIQDHRVQLMIFWTAVRRNEEGKAGAFAYVAGEFCCTACMLPRRCQNQSVSVGPLTKYALRLAIRYTIVTATCLSAR